MPTCRGERDGACLSAAQQRTISRLFAGAQAPDGTRIYQSFPYDKGLATRNWTFWKYTAPRVLDSGGVALFWQVPPLDRASFDGARFALTGDVGAMLSAVQRTNATYGESALSFMQPPHPTELHGLQRRGAKMLLYHGTADPIFSSDDTQAFYEALREHHGGGAHDFARYFPVPGMNHCSGGPSTDPFDMLEPLAAWVEPGHAPDRVIAQARGPGNAAAVNPDVPKDWSPARSRPLCPCPRVARDEGKGSLEAAASFRCTR